MKPVLRSTDWTNGRPTTTACLLPAFVLAWYPQGTTATGFVYRLVAR